MDLGNKFAPLSIMITAWGWNMQKAGKPIICLGGISLVNNWSTWKEKYIINYSRSILAKAKRKTKGSCKLGLHVLQYCVCQWHYTIVKFLLDFIVHSGMRHFFSLLHTNALNCENFKISSQKRLVVSVTYQMKTSFSFSSLCSAL